MASGIMELIRATHEDIEILERGIIEEILNESTSTNFIDNQIQNYMIRTYLDKIVESNLLLQKFYLDKDGTKKAELQNITGTQNVFTLYYQNLIDLKEHHRKFPKMFVPDRAQEILEVKQKDLSSKFNGEEGFGKFLDLHIHYTKFNSFADEKIDYSTYLYQFFKFSDNLAKKNKDYQDYISDLLDYLVDFLDRSNPLFDVKRKKRLDR